MRGTLIVTFLLIVVALLIILSGGDDPGKPPTPPGEPAPPPAGTDLEPDPLPEAPLIEPGEADTTEVAPLPTEDESPPEGPVGSIAGIVLRDDTGEPVAGAHVAIHERRGDGWSATTAEDGTFTIADVTPGVHWLGVTAEGFARGQVKGVEVTADLETGGIVVRLGRGGSIGGIVFGPDGSPEPGAKVVLVPILEGVRILGDLGWKTSADESGAYRFEHLTPGRYHVRRPAGSSTPVVLIDDELISPIESDPVIEVREGETTTFDLRSDRVGSIRGTARSRSGAPVRRQVSLLDASGEQPAAGEPRFVLPDEAGGFELVALPPGEYVLECDGVKARALVQAGLVTDVELVFDTARIEGSVVDETGAPIEGADVWLHRKKQQTFPVRVDITPTAKTGADGRFAFEAVTAGTYYLQAGWKHASAMTKSFDLRAGEVRKEVVIRLDGPVELRVVVLDGEGAPIPGLPVQFGSQEGETDVDGVAVFRASPGRHPIIAGTPPDAVMRVVIVDRSGTQSFTLTKP